MLKSIMRGLEKDKRQVMNRSVKDKCRTTIKYLSVEDCIESSLRIIVHVDVNGVIVIAVNYNESRL